MKEIFVEILKNSFYSVFLITAVLLIRAVISKKAPRWTVCMLWTLVGIRLLVPFSIESNFSLVPNLSVEYKSINTEDKTDIDINQLSKDDSENSSIVEGINDSVSYIENESEKTFEYNSGKTNVFNIVQNVWFSGFCLMIIYGAFVYIRLKKRVSIFSLCENGVRKSENISSPFVVGVFNPKIYIPYGISSEAQSQIIAHEKAHIKRGDHITKLFSFVVLAVHWFNPFVWIYFMTLNKDIEYACDEKVLSGLSIEEKKQYALALLEYSVKKYVAVSPSPVSFGEIGVKKRIKNVFVNKITSKIVYVFAFLLFVSISVLFMTKQDNTQNVIVYRGSESIEVSLSDGFISRSDDVVIDVNKITDDSQSTEKNESVSDAKEFLDNAQKTSDKVKSEYEKNKAIEEKYNNSSSKSSNSIPSGYSTAYTSPYRYSTPYTSGYTTPYPKSNSWSYNPNIYPNMYNNSYSSYSSGYSSNYSNPYSRSYPGFPKIQIFP